MNLTWIRKIGISFNVGSLLWFWFEKCLWWFISRKFCYIIQVWPCTFIWYHNLIEANKVYSYIYRQVTWLFEMLLIIKIPTFIAIISIHSIIFSHLCPDGFQPWSHAKISWNIQIIKLNDCIYWILAVQDKSSE